MNAPLSIWTAYFWEASIEETIDDLIAHGIQAGELSTEHGEALFARGEDVEATGAAVRAYAAERNFTMTQGHLPIWFKIVRERENLGTLLRYIDLYEACGVKNMVLHLDRQIPDMTVEERFQANKESLLVIAEHIKGRDICICLENLYANDDKMPCAFAENLIALIEAVGSDQFGICLDTGHLHISGGNQGEFIRTAGKYLRAIHIADNRGERDEHLMPFAGGTVDFYEVVKALDEIGYEGLFNQEIPGERTNCPLPLRRLKLHYIRETYEYLMSTLEK